VNPDVIGIDLGITLLSAENLRSGHVWTWFMKNPEIADRARSKRAEKGLTPGPESPGSANCLIREARRRREVVERRREWYEGR